MISDVDRAILTRPDTKSLHASLGGFVSLYSAQLPKLQGRVPSYVLAAAEGMLAAFRQWDCDEQTLLSDRPVSR